MPSPAEYRFVLWNRKLHYYLGLYFLFFVWLFALTGLLLNHSSWAFAQFFPNRKISVFDRDIALPPSTGDLDSASSLTRQLGIEGQIAWPPARSDAATFNFNVSRPGRIYQIQADLIHRRAHVIYTQYNGWGLARTLHTFVAVKRDWWLTTVWAFSMDAIAAGIILMVLTGLYMWWGLKAKRWPGLAVLALGTAVTALFVTGLRWIYG